MLLSDCDLQRNKQQTSNRFVVSPPSIPIGTQFALTMLGMHKNASDSLQQHVSSALDTLIQVQNSLSTSTITSLIEQNEPQQQYSLPASSPSPTQNRLMAQNPCALEGTGDRLSTILFGCQINTSHHLYT